MLVRTICRSILFVVIPHLTVLIMNGDSLVKQLILCGVIGGCAAGGWND